MLWKVLSKVIQIFLYACEDFDIILLVQFDCNRCSCQVYCPRIVTFSTFTVGMPKSIDHHMVTSSCLHNVVVVVGCELLRMWYELFSMHTSDAPKGGQGCLISPPCLESQGCHLVPLYYFLSCFSA